ncbi:hypothetical protein [Marinospirillum sp.]|uniref:hypothetical protein n=1 Tax=Marinospirillum sp. TaxID=2183934 RepID=UPI003A859F00
MSAPQIKDQLLPAVIQALLLIVVRLFTIPWEIWSGAASRLSETRLAKKEAKSVSTEKSEFPVFEWFKSSWDAAIFLSWFVGILSAVITLVSISINWSFSAGLASAITILIYSYFAVILMSLLKESLILMLSIALNVEKIAKKNKSQEAISTAEELSRPS